MKRVVLAAAAKASAAPTPSIIPYDGPKTTYNQIAAELEMALLDANFKEIMKPVMCKDYITDAFWSENNNKKTGDIYGLSWTPGTMPKAEQYYLGLRFNDENQAAKSKNIAALLAVWNKALGFKAELIDTTRPTEKIVKFDANWAAQPIRISLLTLMLRVGIAYRPGETLNEFFDDFGFDETLYYTMAIGTAPTSKRKMDVLSHYDPAMIFRAKAKMLKIAESGFPEQTWEQFETASEAHNQSGIVSYDPEEFAQRQKAIKAQQANIAKQLAKAQKLQITAYKAYAPKGY